MLATLTDKETGRKVGEVEYELPRPWWFQTGQILRLHEVFILSTSEDGTSAVVAPIPYPYRAMDD